MTDQSNVDDDPKCADELLKRHGELIDPAAKKIIADELEALDRSIIGRMTRAIGQHGWEDEAAKSLGLSRARFEEVGRRYRPKLHQRPLYLTGRSLFVEDQELYKEASGAVRRADSLAHGDDDETVSKSFRPTRNGAKNALSIALRRRHETTRSWLGRLRGLIS